MPFAILFLQHSINGFECKPKQEFLSNAVELQYHRTSIAIRASQWGSLVPLKKKKKWGSLVSISTFMLEINK